MDVSRPMLEQLSCPLCAALSCHFFAADKRRSYQQCAACQLVFVAPEQRLSAAAEKAEYDLHQNSPDEQGYRQFLSRLLAPLQARLAIADKGLDFGCGPGPTLSVMMLEAGWRMDLYDPFYHCDKTVFEHHYDFITATEVLEHVYQPRAELTTLWSMLKPGGSLAIMTKLLIDKQAFMTWHYKNDPTHVCFYSKPTFSFLARQWQAELDFVGNDVIFLRKPKNHLNE